MEKLEIMEKELKKRLESIEDKLTSILSIFEEVYLPDRKKEIRDLIRKYNGDGGKVIKEMNRRNKIRYGW